MVFVFVGVACCIGGDISHCPRAPIVYKNEHAGAKSPEDKLLQQERMLIGTQVARMTWSGRRWQVL
jgi:hypothetical protein